MTRPPVSDDRILGLVTELMGTCKSLHEVLTGEEENHYDYVMTALDGEIFLCDQCGWWCENSERHDAGTEELCDDCHGEEQ